MEIIQIQGFLLEKVYSITVVDAESESVVRLIIRVTTTEIMKVS